MSGNLLLQDGVSYDKHSFILNGRRTFLNSAAIHYFRMPKEEWRGVLWRAKQAGMNCVDTYFAWNVHEPQEGQWNFSGDQDCGAFLDLCAELGLWVIARPGPYICAEWDFGGFPWWLRQKEGIRYRANDATFLKYVDLYFDRIIPIIRERQHSQGGNVILVQVENEYGYLHDDEAARDYMAHLRDGLISRGIDVPLITCVGGVEGTIEGANFWSHADDHYAKLAAKQPELPKIVTEFWTGWFEHWGAPAATQKTADLYERRQMEALRAGFTGISHYMFFGGTNFGSYGGRTVGSSDIFMVTSYDYDAPLNEYGRITEKYLAAKRVSLFTQALNDFLLESAELPVHEVRATEGLRIRGRQRGCEKLWFAESLREEREIFHVSLGEGRTLPVTAKPGQIVPILDRIELWKGLRLTCNTYIAGNEEVGSVHTVIISADNGQRSYVELEADADVECSHEIDIRYEISQDRKRITFDFFHFEEPQIIQLSIGGKWLRIVVLNRTLSDQAWRMEGAAVRWAIGYKEVDVDGKGKTMAVRGSRHVKPLLLGQWETQGGTPIKRDELRVAENSEFMQAGRFRLETPELTAWQAASLDLNSLEGKRVDRPLAFSEFGQPFGYLIYECRIESDREQTSELIFPSIQDTARVFLNGRQQTLITQVGASGASLQLPQGVSKLQILVQHMGSLNFSPFLGEMKGISGPAYLGGTKQDLRREWRLLSAPEFSFSGADTGTDAVTSVDAATSPSADDSTGSGADTSKHVGPGSTLIHLNEVTGGGDQPNLMRTFDQGDYDQAVLVGAIGGNLRINGREVEMPEYQEWFSFHTVDISDYVINGVNTIEMTVGQTPLDRLELLSYDSTAVLRDWSMTGIRSPEKFQAYEERNSRQGPAWYQTTFSKPIVPDDRKPRLKLRMTGMSKGAIWLNGINIGRYWQIGPQEDYKLPMAWLREVNELVIFDEEGKSPSTVHLLYDEQSEENWHILP